jgi:hypothetical protein
MISDYLGIPIGEFSADSAVTDDTCTVRLHPVSAPAVSEFFECTVTIDNSDGEGTAELQSVLGSVHRTGRVVAAEVGVVGPMVEPTYGTSDIWIESYDGTDWTRITDVLSLGSIDPATAPCVSFNIEQYTEVVYPGYVLRLVCSIPNGGGTFVNCRVVVG